MGLRWLSAPIALLAVAIAGLAFATPARAATPWCGSGEPTADQPDAVSAFAWHVIYAVPSDGTDAFAATVPKIVDDVSAMTAWWRGQDSTRTLRFDLLDAPGCASDAGRVDITFLRLPHASAVYSFETIVSDVAAAGFASPDKAYLVYYDGSRSDQTLCGQGAQANTVFAYTVVYEQACDQVANDARRATVATHEMMHGLGAVPTEAPHYCSNGHVCDSSADLMKASLVNGDSLATLQLDVGRDDYYGHSGSWLDVRDSLLLWRLDQPVTPPPAIAALTASGTATGDLSVSWAAAPAGDSYRVYDDSGQLLSEQQDTSVTTSGAVGDTFTMTVRTVDDAGLLGVPATLRFRFGYGIVDANGTLLVDTVPPTAPTGLHARRSGKQVVLSWARTSDPVGLRGYRVVVPHVLQRLVTGTTLRLPLARLRGKTVQVRAVDRAGNASDPITVRVRR